MDFASYNTPAPLKITYFIFTPLVFVLLSQAPQLDVIGHVLFMLWFASCLFFYPQTVLKVLTNKKYWVLSIYLLYFFMINLYSSNISLSLKRTYAFIELSSVVFMYDFYSRFRIKRNDKVVYIIIAILIFYSIRILIYLQNNPYGAFGARRIMSINPDDKNLMLGGGYALAAGLSILVPVLFYNIINNLKLRNKKLTALFLTLLTLFFFITVVKSLFFISILMCVFGCIYAIFINESISRKVFLLLLFIVAYFMLPTLASSFIDKLPNNDAGKFIEYKVGEVMSSMGEQEYGESTDTDFRFYLYFKSLNTFFENPMFGAGHKVDFQYDFEQVELSGIGNHSQWFDDLAKYGVFVLLWFYYLILARKKSSHKGFDVAFITMIITGFIKSIDSFTVLFIVFFLVPRICDMFESHKVSFQNRYRENVIL